MGEYPLTFSKQAHKVGCEGALYRLKDTVHIDTLGRLNNGGIVAHQYRCNEHWDACPALVYVTERAVHTLAVAAEQRTPNGSTGEHS